MPTRLPPVPRLGLGLGLDPHWGPHGWVRGIAQHPDRASDPLVAFLERYADRFGALAVRYRPRDRARPQLDDHATALDDLFRRAPAPSARVLHHTVMNLATARPYERQELLEFTNALIHRYRFAWVTEPLALLTIGGRPLPAPLPPRLTRSAASACVANVQQVADRLAAPLALSFPAWDGAEPPEPGSQDAYDFFHGVVTRAGVGCALDTGHLLTWRWARGYRGEALLGDLDRLPLSSTIALHLAGAALRDDRLVDAHHGQLLDAQLELATRLLSRCPNIRVVTYAEPRFDPAGRMPRAAQRSLEALEALVAGWMATRSIEVAPPRPHHRGVIQIEAAVAEAALEDRLHTPLDPEAPLARRFRDQVFHRPLRGSGTLAALFADALAPWRRAHPRDTRLDTLARRFLASAASRIWVEAPAVGVGVCLEEAFWRYLRTQDWADGSVVDDCYFRAAARALVVQPDPAFATPTGFRRAPAGWFAIRGGQRPVLYAALAGRLSIGTIRPLVADLLRGDPPDAVARRYQVSRDHVRAACIRLDGLGLTRWMSHTTENALRTDPG